MQDEPNNDRRPIMVDLTDVRTGHERRRARQLLLSAIRVAPADPTDAAVLIRLDGELQLLASPKLDRIDLKVIAWALAKDPPSERMETSMPWAFVQKVRRILSKYMCDGLEQENYVDRVFLGLKASLS
jgi:hypothetical protein